MTTPYTPGQVPDDPKQLIFYLRNELDALKQALDAALPDIDFVQRTAEPARIRPRMVVYADGTLWNPGSGEGIYRRNSANSAWVFLG